MECHSAREIDPPAMIQVWHLLSGRVGLCGELTALLASMGAFHGISSQPMKLCFVDRNAQALPAIATGESPADGAIASLLSPLPPALCRDHFPACNVSQTATNTVLPVELSTRIYCRVTMANYWNLNPLTPHDDQTLSVVTSHLLAPRQRVS